MNRFLGLALSLVLCGAYGQQSPAAQGSVESVAADTFVKLEKGLAEAVQHKDKAALESLVADDYTMTFSFAPANPIERAQWMFGVLNLYTVRSFAIRDVGVKQVGDVAIVSSVYNQQAELNGSERSGDFFVTDVWVRQGGGWKVTARYSSKVEAPPGTQNAPAAPKTPPPTPPKP